MKNYPKLTDIEHEPIRIEGENIQFTKSKRLKEWFELEHTASCTKESTVPHSVVMDLTHETPSKNGWHFPKPDSSDPITAKSSFALTIQLRTETVDIGKGAQLDLRKDSPTDRTFYESFIADVSISNLKKLEYQESITYDLPGARLVLSPQQTKTLSDFARVALRCGR